VVTGSASGSQGHARRFGDEGATVACLDVNTIGAEAAAVEIHRGAGQARPYRCDVSDAEEVETVIARVAEELGRPRCAATSLESEVRRSEEEPVEEFEHILRVNLVGTFAVSARVPAPSPRGRRLHRQRVSSAGLFGQPYNAAYCASKGGVSLMTRAMAVEFSRRGVG